MNLRNKLRRTKPFKYYFVGKELLADSHYSLGQQQNIREKEKNPPRTDIINFLLSIKPNETYYLEIGVRNPEDNFYHINANTKHSVDPGVEFEDNPVDFKMTSDTFFQKLDEDKVLSKDIRFDVIFIDGLHLAQQVDRDIKNAMRYIKDDGFIVLHDCNPPSEWHARESYEYFNTPAGGSWNGTTWKAFLKWRSNPSIYSCCIDSDWGVGILSKTCQIGNNIKPINPFFEFSSLKKNRKKYLNLIDFETLKKLILN
ncbi:class I SAM-dependent methyltransferase [Draconibacterium sp. IB214405]|uniref:class I SAM-dependent methyltransferase n=1 Tax=Draconibacterium sp. IB214405 TaxID=3097352 RepID=UPI002A0D23CC|nr:class I SAM-dependent methyltransferase [Draconibacterium sp. IB214405]MDX8338073.1 class I SAM-dependent methyltransferase [Draconibacterium sp. IB214405]